MTDDLIVERRGRLGVITLNRPGVINALSHEMVVGIAAALDVWESDDSVAAVLFEGAGDRGFCAGGDIVALHRGATSGDLAATARFMADEYRMNSRIANYSKPTIAIQHGIVLGGGIGVSSHCAHRIVTDGSRLGLPEVGIGFIPDIGSTWLLSRGPGELGTAVALSARTVGPADAIAVGLSDVYVPAGVLVALRTALEVEEPDRAIGIFAVPAPDGELVAARPWIDEVFAGDDPIAIRDRLRNAGQKADAFRQGLDRSSPTAVSATLATLRRATRLASLEEALVHEFRASMHGLRTADFVEGVRAQVIDKDRSPLWEPAELSAVTTESVSAYSAVPPEGDLHFDAKDVK